MKQPVGPDLLPLVLIERNHVLLAAAQKAGNNQTAFLPSNVARRHISRSEHAVTGCQMKAHLRIDPTFLRGEQVLLDVRGTN